MSDLYSKWSKKFNSLGDLHSRHDSDMSMYNLDEFKLEDHQGTEIADSYNLTSNRPKIFADKVASSLYSGDLQVIVEHDGKSDHESTEIEVLLRSLYQCIDIYLGLRKEPTLLEILSWQIALRGSIAAVCWPFEEDGELIPHVMPWDTRYTAYTTGNKGITMAGYQMTKTADMVNSDYGYDVTGDENIVTEIWTKDIRSPYIGNELIKGKQWKLNLKAKYTPVIIHECGASAWHRDSGYYKYIGESVYPGIRGLIKGYNRLLSVLNTLNMRAFTNGLQFITEGGAGATVPPNAREDNIINAIGQNDRFYPMPLNDIQQATLMLKNIIDSEILYGTLPLMEYGDMSDQETVAQITTKASKTASVLRARRLAIEMFYNDMAIMLLTQLQERSLPNEINLKGRIIKIPEVKWNLPDFTISHSLKVTSPQKDIASAALAQALAPFVSLQFLLEKIIQVDDPVGVFSQKDRDDVERMMPQVKAFRQMAERLGSENPAEKAEGQLIGLALGINGGQGQEIKAGDAESPARPIAPLFGGKNG